MSVCIPTCSYYIYHVAYVLTRISSSFVSLYTLSYIYTLCIQTYLYTGILSFPPVLSVVMAWWVSTCRSSLSLTGRSREVRIITHTYACLVYVYIISSLPYIISMYACIHLYILSYTLIVILSLLDPSGSEEGAQRIVMRQGDTLCVPRGNIYVSRAATVS